MEFQGLGGRLVQAAFDGGPISSDGGALLLREVDVRLGVTQRLAACFTDRRDARFVEHSVLELVRQRVYGLALGYEDLNDHDDLAVDSLLALAVGKSDPEGQTRRRARDRGRALASHCTLNRLELTPEAVDPKNRYWKILHDPARCEALLVDLFLDAFDQAPEEIVLDFDATDDPVHGDQEGRFFHGYYGTYCYLPLYVFCGDHLLVAKLRTANRDASDGAVETLAFLVARIRQRWPRVRIVVRGDSGFTRDALMTWCEDHQVYYVLGLAKNPRLLRKIGKELVEARALFEAAQHAARVFTHFQWSTKDSWTRPRRVIAKAEHLVKGANPRFIVTNLGEAYALPKALYENVYCARGDMENRIKEQQLDLFADRTSTRVLRANQLRLWFSSLAYVLLAAMRRLALPGTRMAQSTCGSIRTKLLKIGAHLKHSVRRVVIHLASACPYQDVFRQALQNLRVYPLRCWPRAGIPDGRDSAQSTPRGKGGVSLEKPETPIGALATPQNKTKNGWIRP